MKTFFAAISRLIDAFLTLFNSRARRDGAATLEKAKALPRNFAPVVASTLIEKPPLPKKHPFNNRKRTKGRRFYYDRFGKKCFG
ncbi:hypothetical protein C7N43_34505 [Sphingobacteriales bacterium UPWRP_1]|nr:hypothetical protein C7N43_34505 [Sphingobacteriales bacterium UPWRP_1]